MTPEEIAAQTPEDVNDSDPDTVTVLEKLQERFKTDQITHLHSGAGQEIFHVGSRKTAEFIVLVSGRAIEVSRLGPWEDAVL